MLKGGKPYFDDQLLLLKWYCDQKTLLFFFGFQNVVYETHPMRTQLINYAKHALRLI